MRPLIAVSLLSLLLSACGQTGPLYLPKDAPDKKPTPVAGEQVIDETTPQKQEGL